MKTLITAILAIVMLSGCTVYRVKRADGTQLDIASMREFPDGIAVQYETTDGEKQSKLVVQSGAVQNGVDPQALQTLLQLLYPAAPAPKQ